jgi:hypothetical protein
MTLGLPLISCSRDHLTRVPLSEAIPECSTANILAECSGHRTRYIKSTEKSLVSESRKVLMGGIAEVKEYRQGVSKELVMKTLL